MILLTSTVKKLQVVTSSAATVDVHASYVDCVATTAVVSGTGSQDTAISSIATTDVVAVPGGSTTRNVKTLNICNKDAALPVTVTVNINTSAVLTQLYRTLLQAGETLTFIEGIGWFKYSDTTTSLIAKVLAADDTGGQTIATAQPWFPTTGTVTLPAATTYLMRGLLKITSGATSHSTAIGFGGTATLTSINYYAQAHRSAAETIISVFSGINVIAATAAVVDVAGTQVGHYIQINGILRTNAAGTLIPQFTFSVNPTGTITVKKDSFFTLQAIGDNTFAASGSWA